MINKDIRSKEELKAYSDAKFASVSKYCKEVNTIATQFYTDADKMSLMQYEIIERKLVGVYTFINTVYKEVSAYTDSYEDIYFTHLKVKAEIDGVKFVAESAGRESREMAKDLRIVTASLEGWVNNIDQLLCTTRRNLYIEKKERHHG